MHQFDYISKLKTIKMSTNRHWVKKYMIYHANEMQWSYLNNVGEIYLMT